MLTLIVTRGCTTSLTLGKWHINVFSKIVEKKTKNRLILEGIIPPPPSELGGHVPPVPPCGAAYDSHSFRCFAFFLSFFTYLSLLFFVLLYFSVKLSKKSLNRVFSKFWQFLVKRRSTVIRFYFWGQIWNPLVIWHLCEQHLIWLSYFEF